MIPAQSRPQSTELPEPGSSLANPRRITIDSDGRPVSRATAERDS